MPGNDIRWVLQSKRLSLRESKDTAVSHLTSPPSYPKSHPWSPSLDPEKGTKAWCNYSWGMYRFTFQRNVSNNPNLSRNQPATCETNTSNEWCPPGHGDLYAARNSHLQNLPPSVLIRWSIQTWYCGAEESEILPILHLQVESVLCFISRGALHY